MARFDSKVAIVTGGGSGIGAEISRELAAEGASVVVTDINLDAAQRVVDEIVAAGGVASAFEQNTAKWEDSEAAVAFAQKNYGALHLAVNNAGIGAPAQTIGDYDIAAWDRVRAVDLDGVFYGLKFQLPAMVAAGGRAVVNMSSVLGSVGIAQNAAYVASKHALVGLTKVAALEYAAQGSRDSGGITVNGMSPSEARVKRSYGYVFQAPALYPWRTIEKNVALPLEIMGLADREARIKRSIDLVNLTGFEKKYPWQLSGGMQQRASIARALAFDADLLLMDEPFGALDEIVRDHLNSELLKLWARTEKTIAFVTHSIPEAVYLSTKIVVMSPRPGRVTDIIESDLPAERPLDIRETPEFLRLAARVRDGLRAGHSYEE